MKIITPCPSCDGSGKLKRDCCQEEDLRTHEEFSRLKGIVDSIRFCQHCGKLHTETSRMDATGSRDYFFSPATKPELKDLFARMED